LYFRSVGFGFTIIAELVQYSQAKNAKFCLKFEGLCYDLDHVFFLFIFIFSSALLYSHHLLHSIDKHRSISVLNDGAQ